MSMSMIPPLHIAYRISFSSSYCFAFGDISSLSSHCLEYSRGTHIEVRNMGALVGGVSITNER